jgi:cellulose synthase/poly-beta-1,6-N-acetylglucosamine synthase-like glycosyltransferase
MALIFALTLFHCLFFILLSYWWKSIPESDKSEVEEVVGITVLIPFRNERQNLDNILMSLQNQDYPKDHFEVLFINDHSEDGSREFLDTAINQSQFRVVDLPVGVIGKKSATTMGVELAKYSSIVCSDGDCRLGPNWLKSYAGAFRDETVRMVVGPVRMGGLDLFSKIQSMEFAAMIAFGGVLIYRGLMGTCNGANMGFRKAAFQEVNGYVGNHDIPTGDDEFLLQKIHTRFKGGIKFIKSREVVVDTYPKSTLKAFVSQRIRWTSKWRFHQSLRFKMLGVLTFFDFMSAIALLILLLWFPIYSIGLLLLRWCAEWFFLYGVCRFLDIELRVDRLMLLAFIYPFYAVFLGLASIFGHYSWKGRQY